MDALHGFFSNLRLRDVLTAVVDIAIVYYVIYRALQLIKGTRAAQMLLGLLLIGGGFFVAKQLELRTVSWLLDNVATYGIFLAIVVFQHEIRRALMRVGRNIAPSRAYEETHVLEEIVQVASHLAKDHVGAIIVLEREALLDEFIEHGIEVDAKVSKELLIAMFLPSHENVLHDGAVIIRNLRVAQAGAVLPLSANPKLDKALGTRHRAAIGITEETDAAVIVVSEERGTMSLCHEGAIARDLDTQALRRALLDLFAKPKRRRRALRKGAAAPAPADTAGSAASESGTHGAAQQASPDPRGESTQAPPLAEPR